MENGYYKCMMLGTSTSDWIRLNFDAVPTDVVQAMIPDDFDALERLDVTAPEEPCEPDAPGLRDEYESDAAFNDAVAAYDSAMKKYNEATQNYNEAWQEYENQLQSLAGWPVAWGEMYSCDQDPQLVQALIDSGFVVYQNNTDFFGQVLFGVDGGGYNFYAAHWIPLRARLATAVFSASAEYSSPEEHDQSCIDYYKFLDFLYEESKQHGGHWRTAKEFRDNFAGKPTQNS